MPVGHLLEGVAGAQNQRFFHVSTNKLEPNREPVGGLPSGQGECWMPAHIKRCCEAEPGLKRRRRATYCR